MNRFATAFLLFLSLFYSFAVSGQILEGTYKGQLTLPGTKLDVVLTITKPNDWKIDFQVPQQTDQSFPATEVRVSDDSVRFKVPGIPGDVHYAGLIVNPSSFAGTFYQGGGALALTFELEGNQASQVDTSGWHHYLDSVRQLFEVPGYGIAIYYDGKIIYTDGIGYLNVDHKARVNAKTLFAIGSTTKAFTATGNALLVADGKLDWTKPVRDYLPGFAMHDEFASEEMTAEDLLCHRSGLPRHDLLWYGSGFTREELFQKLKYLEPSAPFRTTFQYQNLMFMTAGLLTEKLSGQRWEDFTRSRLFTPLGMDQTNFSVKEMEQNPLASKPCRWTKSGVIEIPYRNIDAIGPAGSINSSAEDMVKWVAFNLNKGKVGDHQLLPADQINYIQKPHMAGATIFDKPGTSEASYGLGWSILYYQNLKIVSHGGNIDGFTAHVHLVPDKGFGMVVLANLNGTPLPSALSFQMMDKVLGIDGEDWIQTGVDRWKQITGRGPEADKEKEEKKEETKPFMPVRELSAYAGTYENPAYGQAQVSIIGGKMHFKYHFMDLDLTPEDVDLFSGQDEELGVGIKAKFDAGLGNYVDQLLLPLEPAVDPIVFTRIASEQWSRPEYLKQFMGTYDVNGLMIEILYEDGKLKMKPTGQPTFILDPIFENQFKVPSLTGYSVSFSGKPVDTIELHQPNGEFTGKKKK
ncbi:MAG: serine hydrolase [Saprospiraceae bacterium]